MVFISLFHIIAATNIEIVTPLTLGGK